MENFIKNKIELSPQKMITYADYIQTVLYHPTLGYYTKEKDKISKSGDFITTSSFSDIYGQLVCRWFIKQMEKHSLPAIFCEAGGGTGKFARAFMEEWEKTRNDEIRYILIESSPYHQKLQKEKLSSYRGVEFYQSFAEIEPFSGVFFSNELFDALPVHVIERFQGELLEVMVTVESGELIETFVPLENEKILSFLEKSSLNLSEGQRIEIPLAMNEVIEQIGRILQKGLVLTVDYGYHDEEWLEPVRRYGSLRGYYQHQMMEDVLQYPGDMDITTHIHFDSFIKKGEEIGLEFLQMMRQDEFFLANGILDELQAHYDPDPFSEISKRNRQIKSLIMPNSISQYFHVIVQGKGIVHSDQTIGQRSFPEK